MPVNTELMIVNDLEQHLRELIELYGEYAVTISVAGVDKLYVPTDISIRLSKGIIEIHAGNLVGNIDSLCKKADANET